MTKPRSRLISSYSFVTLIMVAVCSLTNESANAQFGANLQEFEVKLGKPDLDYGTELHSWVPHPHASVKGSEQLFPPPRSWTIGPEAKFSLWSSQGELHAEYLAARISETLAQKIISSTTFVDEDGKTKPIKWKIDDSLSTVFPPVSRVSTTEISEAIDPYVWYDEQIVTWYNANTLQVVDRKYVRERKVVTQKTSTVDLRETWRKVVLSGERGRFMATYNVHERSIPGQTTAVVERLLISTRQLYLCGRIGWVISGSFMGIPDWNKAGWALDMKGNYENAQFSPQPEAQKRDTQFKLAISFLKSAIDDESVPWDWLEVYLPPKGAEVMSTTVLTALEDRFSSVPFSKRIRRTHALARRGIVSRKLVPNLIAQLKNKQACDEAETGLKELAKLLKSTPQEDFDADPKKWTEWYEELLAKNRKP